MPSRWDDGMALARSRGGYERCGGRHFRVGLPDSRAGRPCQIGNINAWHWIGQDGSSTHCSELARENRRISRAACRCPSPWRDLHVALALRRVQDVGSLRAMPNPMSGSVALDFVLPEPGVVRAAIYDVRGRLVRTLVDGPEPAAEHRQEWNGCDESGRPVPSGVYFYRLEAGVQSATARLVVVR